MCGYVMWTNLWIIVKVGKYRDIYNKYQNSQYISFLYLSFLLICFSKNNCSHVKSKNYLGRYIFLLQINRPRTKDNTKKVIEILRLKKNICVGIITRKLTNLYQSYYW